MKAIDGNKIALMDLLYGERFYSIPEYQRPYSWDEENFEDLITDLLDANKEKEYFLGTVVLHKKPNVLDIVDGQQRFTTIMILLACLRDLVVDTQFKESIQQKIIQKANPMDGIPQKIRLEVKDRAIFSELIVTPDGTNVQKDIEKLAEPEWRYVKAISVFKEKLVNLSQQALQQLGTFLSRNCIMIFLSTDTFDDAFRLFTIVNDRGKQLRRIDILKANNIAPNIIASDTVRRSLSQKWEEWEKTLGSETFENLFFLIRFMMLGEKPISDILKEFEDRIYSTGLITKGEAFVDIVCEYASMYNELFEDYTYFENSSNKNRLISLIYIMNSEFRSNEWKAAIMLYIKKYSLSDFDQFISLIELKYIEGWITGQTKDSRIVVFGNIIKLVNSSKRSKEIFQSPIMAINEKVICEELSGNIYNRQYCKYILLRLELLASEHDVEKRIQAKSVEHVLPQKPNADSKWTKDFTDEEIEFWINKLSNLVLLSKSKNSSAKNLDFDEKKKRYLKNKVTDYPRSVEVLSFENWTPEKLSERQDYLISNVLKNIFN